MEPEKRWLLLFPAVLIYSRRHRFVDEACGGLDVPRRVAGAASDLPGCVFTAKGPDFLASGPSRSIQAFPPLSVISMISSSRPLHISRYLIKVRRRVTCRTS